ncbi:hypothetical protein AB0P04_44000, partial [Streptomyces anulatus]
MPYIYDPYNFRYVYYPPGSKPPKLNQSGKEFIPGMADAYVKKFPNQPYSQQHPTGVQSNQPTVTVDFSKQSSDSGTSGGMDDAKRNAYEYLKHLFEGYGLGSLASKILGYVQEGYDANTVTMMLQDTPEYKQRFAANEQRRSNGLAVLSPAEYLELERSYRQILSSYGMPEGFYDQQSDFQSWIGGDVSPSEINERAQIAADTVNNSDDYYVQSLRALGLGQGDLIAAALDRSRALPVLQKIVKAGRIGAEATQLVGVGELLDAVAQTSPAATRTELAAAA